MDANRKEPQRKRIVLFAGILGLYGMQSLAAENPIGLKISLTGEDINKLLEIIGKGISYLIEKFKERESTNIQQQVPRLVGNLNTLASKKDRLSATLIAYSNAPDPNSYAISNQSSINALGHEIASYVSQIDHQISFLAPDWYRNNVDTDAQMKRLWELKKGFLQEAISPNGIALTPDSAKSLAKWLSEEANALRGLAKKLASLRPNGNSK